MSNDTITEASPVTDDERRMRMSMGTSVHHVNAIEIEQYNLSVYGPSDTEVTRITFRDARGNDFTVTAFTDEQVVPVDLIAGHREA